MRVIDVRDFDIPSDENDYDELVAFADTMASIPQFDAVPMSVIEDIRQIVDNWNDDENAMILVDKIKEVLSCTKVQ